MDIESSVKDLISSLEAKCPNLSPALFLTHLTPKTLDQLCSTPLQKEEAKSWLSTCDESSHLFVNKIDYSQRTVKIVKINSVSELDAQLGSLETIMRLMIVGEETELMVAITRFLEVNGYKGDIPEERHIFNECYNIASAVKVLLRYDFLHKSFIYYGKKRYQLFAISLSIIDLLLYNSCCFITYFYTATRLT